MKRLAIIWATLAVMWFSTTPASAWPNGVVRQNDRQHRYKLGGIGVWVKTNGPGYPAYRYTYRGAAENFPPPAWLYYGNPSGIDGPGFGF